MLMRKRIIKCKINYKKLEKKKINKKNKKQKKELLNIRKIINKMRRKFKIIIIYIKIRIINYLNSQLKIICFIMIYLGF